MTVSDIRRRAWETRRQKYGEKGYGPGAYGLGQRPERVWPSVEYDGGYPVDEEFRAFTRKRPPLDFVLAARWLLQELPRAAENMLCACEVRDGQGCKLIEFSTLGWSGAESLIALINRRIDMRRLMLSWRRGGHYVFEIPLRYLPCDNGSRPKGQDAEGGLGRSPAEWPPEEAASPDMVQP